MKKLHLIILSLLVMSSANATSPVQESETIRTDTQTGRALVENNFKEITELKDKIGKLDYILENFATCEAKNKAYLGENVKGADNDNCVDIQALPTKMISKEPKFVGFLANPVFGTITERKADYQPSDTAQTWHRSRADALCKAKYANSRAMTYHDVKFMHDALPIKDNYFNNPDNTVENKQSIWLFEAEQSLVDTNQLGTQFASTLLHNSCQGWSSNSVSDYGIAVEVHSYLQNRYLKYVRKSCYNAYLVACVRAN